MLLCQGQKPKKGGTLEDKYLESLELYARQSKGILEAIGFFLFYTTATGIIGLFFGVVFALTGEDWALLFLVLVGLGQLGILVVSISMFNSSRQADAKEARQLTERPSNAAQPGAKFYDCKKCGKQPEPGHDYCTNCGTRHEIILN